MIPVKNSLEVSKSLLQHTGHSLRAVSKLSKEELLQIEGITPSKALAIIGAFQISQRARIEESSLMVKFQRSQEVYEYIYPYFGDNITEDFYALYLSRSNNLLKRVRISQGGLTGTVADPLVIAREAII